MWLRILKNLGANPAMTSGKFSRNLEKLWYDFSNFCIKFQSNLINIKYTESEIEKIFYVEKIINQIWWCEKIFNLQKFVN